MTPAAATMESATSVETPTALKSPAKAGSAAIRKGMGIAAMIETAKRARMHAGRNPFTHGSGTSGVTECRRAGKAAGPA